ncbi:enoyl-CoA delta isomerase 1, mitochondrial-like [Sabethes cyaneus]|uniref:enoyl-CoA delta isomerase 1, mitochondrial-like n=1 Tax=Sabethes cyaneus TaxID=53552 RepID=UPI00237E9EB6|nr:enoyl-CoA delta isomerase 1, mitochondrial-like [Sabethes cyaneus]
MNHTTDYQFREASLPNTSHFFGKVSIPPVTIAKMLRSISNSIYWHHLARQYSGSSITPRALILTEIDGKTGYAKITLNRAPVNALNLEMISAITSTVNALERDKVNGMVLTSFSDKVFSAGLDIKEMINPDIDRLRTFWSALQELWLKLYGCAIPTVAAINGHAPAGGCFLAIACDYRVMCNNFTIGLNETVLGIIVPRWLQVTMRNTIGFRQTELACTTGKLFNSTEAFDIGLVDELVDNNMEAIRKAVLYLDKCKTSFATARQITKHQLRQDEFNDFKRYREKDLEAFVANTMREEFQIELEEYLKALKVKP